MLSMSSFAVYNGVHYVYCSLFYFTEIIDCAFVHYVFFSCDELPLLILSMG